MEFLWIAPGFETFGNSCGDLLFEPNVASVVGQRNWSRNPSFATSRYILSPAPLALRVCSGLSKLPSRIGLPAIWPITMLHSRLVRRQNAKRLQSHVIHVGLGRSSVTGYAQVSQWRNTHDIELKSDKISLRRLFKTERQR